MSFVLRLSLLLAAITLFVRPLEAAWWSNYIVTHHECTETSCTIRIMCTTGDSSSLCNLLIGKSDCPVDAEFMALATGDPLKRSRCGTKISDLTGEAYSNIAGQASAYPGQFDTHQCKPGCISPYVPDESTLPIGRRSLGPQIYCHITKPWLMGGPLNQQVEVQLTVEQYRCTRVVSWPSDAFSEMNACTNITPQRGELCLRHCTTSADCLQGLDCYEGKCMCDGRGANVCGPGLRCLRQWGDPNFISLVGSHGHCFCDPTSSFACDGTSTRCQEPPAALTTAYDKSTSTAPTTPDTKGVREHTLVVDGLGWTVWHRNHAHSVGIQTAVPDRKAWGPSRQLSALNLPAYLVADGLLWVKGFNANSGWDFVRPGVCVCPDSTSMHGPQCSGSILDQCKWNMCGGQGDCVHFTTKGAPPPPGSYYLPDATNNADPYNRPVEPFYGVYGIPDPLINKISHETEVMCVCSPGLDPFPLLRFDLQGQADSNANPFLYPFRPGTACTNPTNRRVYYCNGHGNTYSLTDSRCYCDVAYTGTTCLDPCTSTYCSNHAASCAKANGVDSHNICAACAVGWGPSQTGDTSSSDRDDTYLQRWCRVPYGEPVGVATADQGVPRECNGRGISVDLSLIQPPIAGLPSRFVVYNSLNPEVRFFDTHPSRIRRSLLQRFGITITDAQLTYYRDQVYNSGQHTQCLWCEDGYRVVGGTCVPDLCQAWTTCHASDTSCLEAQIDVANAVLTRPDGQACGVSLQRGVCALSASPYSAWRCACEDGFGGADCGEVRCSWANGAACAGNGLCDEATNRCICNEGWVGMACEIPDSDGACNGHGQVRRVNPPAIGNPHGEVSPYDFSEGLVNVVRTVWY